MAIELIAKIKPKNNGSFAMVDAEDVETPDGGRLLDYLPVILTQSEYDTLVDGGTITINGKDVSYEENRIYMIKRPVYTEGAE